ncbi:MAG: CvpA family protein [Chloroflexi bacterium]|nr:CvpA family protein [Chloroflexota bacterium]
MNWLSVVLIAVIAFVTWRAWRNGFIRELVSLAGVILAVPIAGIFYDNMYPKVHPIVGSAIDNPAQSDALAKLISFIAILVAVIIGGQVVAYLLRRAVTLLNLGFIDQGAGAVFGFLKAVLVCQVVLIALVAFPKPDLTGAIDGSSVATALLDTAPAVLAILPSTFDRATNAFLDGANALDGRLPGATPTATGR